MAKEVAKSELWVNLLAGLGAALPAMFGNNTPPWVTLGLLVLMTVVYTASRTPLVADKPGWKTKEFWISIAVIVATVAVAVAEAKIPGLPEGISKGASIIVAVCTAMGYTAVRLKIKNEDETKRRVSSPMT